MQTVLWPGFVQIRVCQQPDVSVGSRSEPTTVAEPIVCERPVERIRLNATADPARPLTGMARLVGPEGGTYGFDAALLRAFLQTWTRNNVDATCRVKTPDGRSFEFPQTLTGTARLIGPQGGAYEFDAELLR
jgi:hypothetical protein